MKPHAHARPMYFSDTPYKWCVDCYDGRGIWTGASVHDTEAEAKKRVRVMNRRLREPEKAAVQCKHKYKNGNQCGQLTRQGYCHWHRREHKK